MPVRKNSVKSDVLVRIALGVSPDIVGGERKGRITSGRCVTEDDAGQRQSY